MREDSARRLRAAGKGRTNSPTAWSTIFLRLSRNSPQILWNPKNHRRVRAAHHLSSVPCQINPVPEHQFIILPSTPGSSKWPLFFRLCSFLLRHSCYMSEFTRFDQSTPRTFSGKCKLCSCSWRNSGQFPISSSPFRLT